MSHMDKVVKNHLDDDMLLEIALKYLYEMKAECDRGLEPDGRRRKSNPTFGNLYTILYAAYKDIDAHCED